MRSVCDTLLHKMAADQQTGKNTSVVVWYNEEILFYSFEFEFSVFMCSNMLFSLLGVGLRPTLMLTSVEVSSASCAAFSRKRR